MTDSTGQVRKEADQESAADRERDERQDVEPSRIDANDPHKAEKLTRRKDYDADEAVE